MPELNIAEDLEGLAADAFDVTGGVEIESLTSGGIAFNAARSCVSYLGCWDIQGVGQ